MSLEDMIVFCSQEKEVCCCGRRKSLVTALPVFFVSGPRVSESSKRTNVSVEPTNDRIYVGYLSVVRWKSMFETVAVIQPSIEGIVGSTADDVSRLSSILDVNRRSCSRRSTRQHSFFDNRRQANHKANAQRLGFRFGSQYRTL